MPLITDVFSWIQFETFSFSSNLKQTEQAFVACPSYDKTPFHHQVYAFFTFHLSGAFIYVGNHASNIHNGVHRFNIEANIGSKQCWFCSDITFSIQYTQYADMLGKNINLVFLEEQALIFLIII